MNRSWYGLLLLALVVPACKTGGPKAPPGAPVQLPDLLRPYENAGRVLRHEGDERTLTVKAGERLTGDCDVAVRVRRVAFDKGSVRFTLERVGLPKVGEREARCKRVEPAIQLAFTGVPEAVTPQVTARIDEVLPTPEAYLRAKGKAFDRPPVDRPFEVASQLADASESERKIARAVVAWPRLLLSVDPTYRDPARRVHYEGLVEFEAVVGPDGRLHRPQLKTSLSQAHESAVVSATTFWRFEPARRADAPVGARVPLRLVFRIY